MSAHADDLRYFYAEHIGTTRIVAAGAGAPTTTAEKLSPGRYAIRFRNVVGATTVWVRQGKFGATTAATAEPSTPFPVGAVINTMVRAMAMNDSTESTDGLSFITDAGTCDVVVTKVSRDKQ